MLRPLFPIHFHLFLSLAWVLLSPLWSPAQLTGVRLGIAHPDTNNPWLRLNSTLSSSNLLTLQASTNFQHWQVIGTLHDALRSYPDPAATNLAQRFYRVHASPRTFTNDWKNELLFPNEAFRSTLSEPGVRWVKFAILLNDLTRVFYQDSTKFPFHFQFATQRLPPFLGMDALEFDAVSLYRTNQQVVLGTVLYPPGTNYVEYGVQFTGRDLYTPEEIARWFELVKATVYASNGAGIFYMPSFEQSEMARTNAEAFAAHGISIASIERWLSLNHVYSPGWAVGRLRFFPATEIDAAFADGRLKPEDILLTDGVPAETPLVAGILSLTPSTPNSHTALLAQSFGIPFAYLSDPAEQQRVQGLAGRKVVFRAIVTGNRGEIKVLDVEQALSPALESELLALKTPAPLQFAAKQPFGAFSASTDTLVPTDIQFFGGKAANYSLLRTWVPSNAPPAIAFSFDLWDAFMDQVLTNGSTLRSTIASRLAPYTNYPPDIPSLQTDLAAIRDLLRQSATFTAAQKSAITNALKVFSSNRNIRFRSSTNVEDSENFTGAGLYDSFSGCLDDDLDGDTLGPSRCDPAEANERGVFRAIQRVYASFYNPNAFLERLRHGVDESKVGMGVLVHHSFPDNEELANGVATLRFSFTSRSTNISGNLVSQLGAESVTNPDGSSIPEVVAMSRFSGGVNLTLTRNSSLVPLGAYVMEWQKDYLGFVDLLTSIGYGYKQFYPSKNGFYLDFEYKKDTNLGLVVKQVREIPAPPTTNQTTAFLFHEPTTFCVAQKEFTDAFSNHRLKSLWTLQTTNMRMFSSNLVSGIYTQGRLEYISNGTVQVLSGPLTSWPNASNTPSGSVNSWTTGSGTHQLAWRMDTTLKTNVTGSTPPIYTQQDFARTVQVTYPQPMPTVFANGQPSTTTNESVILEPCPKVTPGALLQQRYFATNAVQIESSFYWPNTPPAAGGYTAPLVRFVQTRITGLTTSPIVLTNYFSQTYRPTHHNFTEEFIFEPRLEPGLSTNTVAELQAANIQLIYVFRGFRGAGSSNVTVRALGLDQKFHGFQ